jgi:hypothetical protein
VPRADVGYETALLETFVIASPGKKTMGSVQALGRLDDRSTSSVRVSAASLCIRRVARCANQHLPHRPATLNVNDPPRHGLSRRNHPLENGSHGSRYPRLKKSGT